MRSFHVRMDNERMAPSYEYKENVKLLIIICNFLSIEMDKTNCPQHP